ncbi:integrator complex subunit 6-like [Actinia tenebrosa]|uniref:Integrator complex subunit 6-like n=1 Tax=Actinia tenebrosa TaxID=6105 RepID=A0A6P8HUJ4_ACTTE|nr:integrator complex subunit 6-like [Actinia tenebrosa]
MVNLVFVVDTSASMNQRTSLGTTLLDVAKNAVETFIKIRQRDQASRTDRLMLVTLDEPPRSVKVGWNGSQPMFYNELRNLQATGLSTLGSALKDSFDLLNLYRLTSGIDNYGMGRKPFYLDPAIVVCITDGSSLVSKSEVEKELHLPMHSNLPGSDLTKEPFRWDQRLFGLVLRMAGCRGGPQTKGANAMLSTEPALAAMCEVTGGKCYKASSSKSLGQALESIVQKIQCGIVVNFEKIGGPDPSPPIPAEGPKNNILRETDSPTPPPIIDGHNHIGNNVDASGEQMRNRQVNSENHQPIKTEGLSTSGTVTPSLTPRGDSLAAPPVVNGLAEEGLISNGISRSATASPIPQISQPASWTSCCKMIYIKANMEKDSLPTGYWPIPETFWPDPAMPKLAPRDAQPKILFNCEDSEPQVLENFPFDKYELEPSPLTQYILERKSPSTCWQTFIYNSGRKNGEVGSLGCTFGYLKASTNLQAVNLFVMPYNYPVLFPLLDELVKLHKIKPVPKWKQAFDAYLLTVPSYYAAPLRNAFKRMGIPTSLIPDHMDGALSFQIINYLKSVKQKSKIEAKRFESLMGKNSSREIKHKFIPSIQTPELPSTERKDYHSLLNHTATRENSKNPRKSGNDINTNEVVQAMKEPNGTQRQCYKNPYDINRGELLDQLSRMRINFFHMATTSTILQEEDARHSIAISEMGNYGKVLRQGNQLREVDPGQNRAHMFGNPYKLAKDQRVMVDEADVNEAAKRKRPDTPPVKWPTSIHHDAPSPVHHHYQEQQETLTDKPIINKENKDMLTNDIKPNNITPHQRKRKPSEDISEGGAKPAKAAKHHIHPQLKKLQRLHQIKGQLPKKGQVLSNSTDLGKNSCLNNVDRKQDVSDISSILRTALSSKDKGDEKEPLQVTNNIDGLLQMDNRTSQNSTPSSSPSLVSQRQLMREAHEENTQIRTAIFKELRKHEKVNDEVLAQLGNLKGPVELQCSYLNEIIEESLLFKKKILVTKLTTLLKKLQAGMSPNNCTDVLQSR